MQENRSSANRPKKEEPQKTYEFKLHKTYAPPTNHPWRRNYAYSSPYQQKEKAAPKEKELLLIQQG